MPLAIWVPLFFAIFAIYAVTFTRVSKHAPFCLKLWNMCREAIFQFVRSSMRHAGIFVVALLLFLGVAIFYQVGVPLVLLAFWIWWVRRRKCYGTGSDIMNAGIARFPPLCREDKRNAWSKLKKDKTKP